jgi:hypothetical protein
MCPTHSAPMSPDSSYLTFLSNTRSTACTLLIKEYTMEVLESITLSKGERAPFSQLDSNFSFGNNLGRSLTHFRTPYQPASISFLFDIRSSDFLSHRTRVTLLSDSTDAITKDGSSIYITPVRSLSSSAEYHVGTSDLPQASWSSRPHTVTPTE